MAKAPLKSQKRASGRKIPADILGIDFAFTAVKLVRLRRGKDGLSLVGADLLPAVALGEDEAARPAIPKGLLTNYAAVALSGSQAVVRLLSLPGQLGQSSAVENHIREHVGLDGQFRLAYAPVPSPGPAKGKAETRFLAVALPEAAARSVLTMFSAGPPAARALEVSGLATLAAFDRGPGRQHREDAVGVIEAGAKVCFVSLFHRGALVLVRKFEFGGESLVAKVQQQMGVDAEIARGVISDGSFDVSSAAREVMGPFLRQLAISRDFVERKENCRIARMYLSGGMSRSPYWREEIKRVTGVDVAPWNPFDGLHGAENLPENLRGEESRFCAAVGVALGSMQES